jgi:hypothetical protein
MRGTSTCCANGPTRLLHSTKLLAICRTHLIPAADGILLTIDSDSTETSDWERLASPERYTL